MCQVGTVRRYTYGSTHTQVRRWKGVDGQRHSPAVLPPAKRLGRLQLKCDGTRWRTGGEVKGKLVNGVGTQYPSLYLGTWCIQHYYRWCAHLGCQSWRPRRFKWTHPFRRKTKSGFCACAITFQMQSNHRTGDWVGFVAGLVGSGKSRHHRSLKAETSSPKSSAFLRTIWQKF